MAVALAGFSWLYFAWPESGPSPSPIATQGGGTGGSQAGGGGGGAGAPGGPGGTYIQGNQINNYPTPTVSAKSVVLVSDYRMAGLPITVPPHSMFYILPLRAKAPNPPVVFGVAVLFSVDNTNGDKPLIWPPADIQPKREPSAPIWLPEFSWRCEVKNIGETPIINATLTFMAHFGSDVHPLPVRIGALNAGDTFTLWIVNEGDVLATVDRPKTIDVQIPGESERRTVCLTQGGSNLLDILPNIFFGPTRNNWPQ